MSGHRTGDRRISRGYRKRSEDFQALVARWLQSMGLIVIFEQPEIHLHPRVQADLADLFIEAIHARKHGDRRGVQFIIESHSEHFLRRLQRRIAEEALKPDDVALYFCEPEAGGATIRELETDDFGNIKNWPEHFFGG